MQYEECTSRGNWIPRILVVDDNPAIHEDFRKVLTFQSRGKSDLEALERTLFGDVSHAQESVQFELDSALQGADALEMIQTAYRDRHPYAMAFVDIRMPPGWDGVETVSRIWEQFPDLQMVICSAYSDYQWHDIRSRLKHRENLLILKKPFDTDEVVQIALALTEKWRLTKAAVNNLEQLERTVLERTRELQVTNEQLQQQIAQRELAESHLRKVAFHDALTGLPNRRNLQDSLQDAIQRGREGQDQNFAVLFVDVDRFKSINDQFGHEAGDQLLMQFSNRITGCLRSVDEVKTPAIESTTGRLGGDEFVVIVRGLHNPLNAARIAERLLAALETPYQLCGRTIHVTPSIGVVYFDPRYTYASEMLRDADTAMYEAKARGGDCFVVFDANMLSAIQYRLRIEQDLWDALSNQQLYVAYQPIWGLADGKLQGVEALARWNHPTMGVIPPDDFIPIAEQTKLILPLGEWVLREACRQFQEWKTRMPTDAPRYVSVNLSRVQLLQPELIQIVQSALEDSGLRGPELQVEITESLIMQDPKRAGEVFGQLKELGVRLAIDDFGTGHSSLACLYEFNFDVLKIDRSFINHLNDARTNSELILSIVRLAQKLGLECVAEGVEMKEQLRQLGNMGCSSIQGYLVGEPKRGNDIVDDFRKQIPPSESESVPIPANASEAIMPPVSSMGGSFDDWATPSGVTGEHLTCK